MVQYSVHKTMRILLVNKFYFPQGGADLHVLQLEQLLTAAGHEVAVFAMAHPKNQPSRWSDSFVSEVDFSRVRFGWAGMRVLGRTLWSFEAARKMKKLLRDFNPDVVHIHNIYHQISPSILPVIKKAGIPIVQTLHDYYLLSANYSLYAHDGICQHGKDGNFFSYIKHRCIKNSFFASALASVEKYVHGGARIYLKHIHHFIAPSAFMKDLTEDWLGRPLPMTVLHNSISSTVMLAPRTNRLLYVGRLSPEKGVDVLLRALAGTDIALDIVGTGPAEESLHRLAGQLGLQNVAWHGYQPPEKIAQFMASARALVVPSQWYENYPLVILEAFAQGTPVIGSRMGGIPELVKDGQTGALFSANNIEHLRTLFRDTQDHPDRWAAMSAATQRVVAEHTPRGYIERLIPLYASLR